MNPVKSLLTITSVVAVLQSSAWAAQTAGYALDELSGTIAGDGVRGAAGQGTLFNFGGVQWVPGKIGGALEFDGSNDFVLALNVLPTGTQTFSLSMWAWADTTAQWGSLVKNWSGPPGSLHLGFDNATGRLSNYLGLTSGVDGPVIAPTGFSTNTWHHVALTFDGPNHSEVLYIDGVSVATRSTNFGSTSLVALGTNMGFGVKLNDTTTGASTDCCPGYWDGKMDDIVFFDNVLTPAEVLQIKTNGDNGISAVVPEPGSALLAGMGAAALFLRRRR
jgi:hypothetical protein